MNTSSIRNDPVSPKSVDKVVFVKMHFPTNPGGFYIAEEEKNPHQEEEGKLNSRVESTMFPSEV